jgi:ankyrin repeat protein
VKNKRFIIAGACLFGVLAVPTVWVLTNSNSNRNLNDEALLALIKNDQKAFASFIKAGGKLHEKLPAIDGETYTVAQGIAYFERSGFGNYLNTEKIQYVEQSPAAPFDIMTLAISKNNPELFKQLLVEKPKLDLAYGKNGWTYMHMASAQCSHKLTSLLHQEGKLNWNQKASDGSTPLTLAAQHDCLPILSYWKEHGADFHAKNGKGQSALSILHKKKDAALVAFAESFENRVPAAVAKIPDFYRKRKIPKDQIVDHSALIEPEERPLEATETAEFSEFAD